MNAAAIARVDNTEKGSPETSGWAILDVIAIANIDDHNQVWISKMPRLVRTHVPACLLYNEKYPVMKMKHNSIATYGLRTYKRNADPLERWPIPSNQPTTTIFGVCQLPVLVRPA